MATRRALHYDPRAAERGTGLLRSAWEERKADEFVVDAARGELDAAVDGEPDVLATPIDFRVEPRALRVLLPAE